MNDELEQAIRDLGAATTGSIQIHRRRRAIPDTKKVCKKWSDYKTTDTPVDGREREGDRGNKNALKWPVCKSLVSLSLDI